MPNPIVKLIARFVIEGPAARQGLPQLRQQLERSGDTLAGRFEAASDTPQGRKLLRHIIGIERWGQRRLQVVLGDLPFEADGHQKFLPSEEARLPQLVSELRETRAETLALAERVGHGGVADERVPHDFFGPLSAAGWMRYLRLHSDREAKRLPR
jgi:hypothetical protein